MDGALPQGVDEECPLTADGFRDQEARCVLKLEGCGMELNEFQIFDCGSGLPGQRNAFAAGLCWVGGVGEEVASTSGG
jgi:hypothetical protein